MLFLESFSIQPDKDNPFPFRIPSIKYAKEIKLDRITIFMGNNGCGKSTLLEAIALKLKLPLFENSVKDEKSFEAAQIIQPFLKLKMQRSIETGLFFRSEDLTHYIHAIVQEKNILYRELKALKIATRVAKEMSENQSYRLRQMLKTFGSNLQELSQGEACMAILEFILQENHILILDEPEMHLHPTHIERLVELFQSIHTSTQIVMATHSPIIASMPNAKLYSIEEGGIFHVQYRDTAHFKTLKKYFF